MRLIDADNLLEQLQDDLIPYYMRDHTRFLESLLKAESTAYYPDKVIDQLKEEGIIEDDYKGHRAIEIIQRGGYEDVPWQQEE